LDEAVTPAAAEATRRIDAPSSELELDLDLEDLASESAAATHGAAADDDINAVVESASAGRANAPGSPADRLDASGHEPDIGVSETPVAKGAVAVPMPSGEDVLDLSDLEAMLEGEGKGGAPTKPAAATEGIDLELDLGAAVEDEAKAEKCRNWT